MVYINRLGAGVEDEEIMADPETPQGPPDREIDAFGNDARTCIALPERNSRLR